MGLAMGTNSRWSFGSCFQDRRRYKSGRIRASLAAPWKPFSLELRDAFRFVSMHYLTHKKRHMLIESASQSLGHPSLAAAGANRKQGKSANTEPHLSCTPHSGNSVIARQTTIQVLSLTAIRVADCQYAWLQLSLPGPRSCLHEEVEDIVNILFVAQCLSDFVERDQAQAIDMTLPCARPACRKTHTSKSPHHARPHSASRHVRRSAVQLTKSLSQRRPLSFMSASDEWTLDCTSFSFCLDAGQYVLILAAMSRTKDAAVLRYPWITTRIKLTGATPRKAARQHDLTRISLAVVMWLLFCICFTGSDRSWGRGA